MIPQFETQIKAALSPGAVLCVNSENPSQDPFDAFLQNVRKASPFLCRLIDQSKDRLPRILSASAENGFQDLWPQGIEGENGAEAKKRLRQARADMALAIALADVSGVWQLEDVVGALSHFADLCIEQALQAAWQDVLLLRGLKFRDAPPSSPLGLIIVGMGKLGAQELNYSSDIDLVAIYDPHPFGIHEQSRVDARGVAIKTVQAMVDILSQQTEDGFVFRTDLRLRPNPSTTGVAVSLPSAERYYQEYGQNWERAAYIKARVCAGNKELGAAFLKLMHPFTWRRTLDYGAVADIHAVKKQIHAEKGVQHLQVRGGNIKLGPGGIREIEFFAQTQQLLFGGRYEGLQTPKTVEALDILAQTEHITPEIASGLKQAYAFLRNLEHRLQMREDCQTQTIPDQDDAVAAIALLMNEKNIDHFLETTRAHLLFVHNAYAELFETPEPTSPVPGSLVFTGVEDDPRTIETLTSLGFADPSIITSRIRRWHQAGLRATRSVRARELLTDLVPRILTKLSELDDPQGAFTALDAFLTALPGGFQAFALFTAHPEVLDDILVICQSSPELAAKMAQRPSLIEGLLEGSDISPPDFPAPQPDDILEDRLDTVRRVVNEHRIRVGASLALGRADPHKVSLALSNTADRAIKDLIGAVRADIETPPEGDLAVLGFGRLGVRGLTPLSDLDLVFVYDPPNGQMDHEKGFTRLIRRIVNALSVPTTEGPLYEIDMKLRPSGGAGPTVVSLPAFYQYYQQKAWVWEEMALTKARVVLADGEMGEKLDTLVDNALVQPRDRHEVFQAVGEMRQRLLREKPPKSPLDVKRLRGGLIDIDFLVQGMSLIHGHELGRLPRNNVEALTILMNADKISRDDAEILCEAYVAYEALIQYVRATFGDNPPGYLSALRARRLSQLSSNWNEDDVPSQVVDYSAAVAAIFNKIIHPPGDKTTLKG